MRNRRAQQGSKRPAGGGNKSRPASFHYTRYQGSREPFINNEGKLISPRWFRCNPSAYRRATRNSSGELSFLLERVCVTFISVATLGRLSGAFPPPSERSPLEKVGRGGGYLGVLSVISLALLLPALSPSPFYVPCQQEAMSQPTFTPGAGES